MALSTTGIATATGSATFRIAGFGPDALAQARSTFEVSYPKTAAPADSVGFSTIFLPLQRAAIGQTCLKLVYGEKL
jgi:hypothetical protein